MKRERITDAEKELALSTIREFYLLGKIGKIVKQRDVVAIEAKIKERHNKDFRIGSLVYNNKVGRGDFDISDIVCMSENTMNMAVVSMKKKVSVIESEEDTYSFVPEINPVFVKFGNYKTLETIVKSREFFPVYVYGPTGNGKSTMVEQIHANQNLPMIRVNLDMETDEDKLIGRQSLEDGNIVIIEGPVLIAMRKGMTILLDEIDAGRANALMCLQGILEGKPYYFKLKNEVIKPAKGFNIIVTANTKGQGAEDNRYVGTNVLNEAFLDRFVLTLNQEYPPEKVERDIIAKLMEAKGCENEKVLAALIKWCTAIRITYTDGGCNEMISTRRMAHIVNSYAMFKDITKSVKLATNRFDSETGSAFLNLFEKIFDEGPTTEQPEETGVI